MLGLACISLLSGCTEAACTLAGGQSGVSVDATALGLSLDAGVEVCLEANCIPLGWTEHLGGQGQTAHTLFRIDQPASDKDELVLAIRGGNGEIIAGPSQVVLRDTYPNGNDCPPKLRTAVVTISPTGEIQTS